MADVVEFADYPRPARSAAAWSRGRLEEIAAMELAACDAADLPEALRLSELFQETAERIGAP